MFPSAQPGDEFQSEVFKSIRCPGEPFSELRFYDCIFDHCEFTETAFKKCRFSKCHFKNCTLDLMRITGSSFSGTRFEKNRCAGIDWTTASWERKSWLGAIQFSECSVNHNTFFGLKLPKLVLNKCSAVNANFEEADLTESSLRYTDFANSRFFHTNLTGADLCGATNYLIQPQHNTLKQTRFSMPEALTLLYALDIAIIDPDRGSEEMGGL